MDWETYRHRFMEVGIATHKSTLIAHTGVKILEDFPDGLPEPYHEAFTTLSLRVMRATAKLLEEADDPDGNEFDEELREAFDADEIEKHLAERDEPEGMAVQVGDDAIRLMMLGIMRGGDPDSLELEFDRALASQSFVMILAHLDAFLADSVRAICSQEMRPLRSEKKISWDEVLDAGNWDSLVRRLIEKRVYDFGWNTLSDRLQTMRDEFGLALEEASSVASSLEEASNVRHVIVHNGGRTSQEFLSRTGRDDLVVGEQVPLTLDDVAETAAEVRVVCSDVFFEVSEIFYGRDPVDEGTGIWQATASEAGDEAAEHEDG